MGSKTAYVFGVSMACIMWDIMLKSKCFPSGLEDMFRFRELLNEYNHIRIHRHNTWPGEPWKFMFSVKVLPLHVPALLLPIMSRILVFVRTTLAMSTTFSMSTSTTLAIMSTSRCKVLLLRPSSTHATRGSFIIIVSAFQLEFKCQQFITPVR